jgi:hypothetical protein
VNKNLLFQLEKYLASLKAANPTADFTTAESALASLAGALKILDPPDPFRDAVFRGAGLAGPDPDPASLAGDDADFAAAVRRGMENSGPR